MTEAELDSSDGSRMVLERLQELIMILSDTEHTYSAISGRCSQQHASIRLWLRVVQVEYFTLVGVDHVDEVEVLEIVDAQIAWAVTCC